MQELERLRAEADASRAARTAARHKTGRETLGVPPVRIEALASEWRAALNIDDRVDLARALWDSDIHEARLAAARLLVQARMRPDDGAWQAILEWAPDIDGAEIGDAVMAAASRRLLAVPERLDQIEPWVTDANPWLRRAALVATGPWARMNNLKPADRAVRERVLAWTFDLSRDRNGAVRQAVDGWLRDLNKHDPDRAAIWRTDRDAQDHQER